MKTRSKKITVRAPRGVIYPHYKGFRAEVTIGGHRERDTFPTEEAAQLFLLELCRRHERGISIDKTQVKLSELVELFMAEKEAQGRKKTTLQSYGYAARYVLELLGELPAQQLRPDHLSRFLAELRSRGQAPKYRRNIYGFLHAVLAFGVAREVLERNVADRVEAPAWDRQPPKAWKGDNVERFQELIAGNRLEAMWWVFLSTGLRVGELAALKWRDVDTGTGEVTVERRVIRLRTGLDVDTPKSRAGVRRVHLPGPVLAKLTEWRGIQEREKAMAEDRWEEGGWLFTTWKGNTQGGHKVGHHLEPRWILVSLTKLLRKAGLEHMTIHGLRHTFCSMLLANNVPLKDVQEVAGHSRPSITLDVYWQSLPGASERVAGSAAELFFAPKPAPPADDCPEIAPKIDG